MSIGLDYDTVTWLMLFLGSSGGATREAMLSNFFKMDEPFEEFDEAKLNAHFRVSRDLRSVLYRPDRWPDDLVSIKRGNFKNVSLSKTEISKVTFTECHFEDCLFIGTTFIEIEFHRCKFVNCNFYKSRFEECYLDPRCITFDKKYRQEAANVGVHFYQQLFENAAKSRQADFSMNADFEFRRWKRWQLPYDEKVDKLNKFELIRNSFASIIYEYVAGFGYRPFRFMGATLILFLSVSAINMIVLKGGLVHDGVRVTHIGFGDSVFYTFSMMTALGFSSIIPEAPLAKIVAVGQALVGIGWLGLFTSLLVKRFIK